MRKTMTFVAIMLLAVAANATALWEETFDRNGTYIEKVEGQYWPYANQWFTGYTGGSGEITGSCYSFDYTNVTSQGVSIRTKRLNGGPQNTIGLYFPANKTEDNAFVQFEGTLAASAGNRYLIFEICSPESSGGDLSTMVVKVNGNAVTVPATTLGAKSTTSIVCVELPNEAISSIYFAFNNVPTQKFITHPRIVDKDNVIIYTATSKLDETTVLFSYGLHTNAFNVPISSHIFSISDGEGMIIFNGEVTTIGRLAFTGCEGLISITIPNSVTTIGTEVFVYCDGLTSVTIPNSVTTIGEYAFCGCSGLTSITIPNSVTTIGEYTFSGCTGLTFVTIPNSVTTIGNYAFKGCSGLASVTIPNSVTTIGDGAFYGCSGLTSVTIPNSVTTIGEWAFANCSGLTSVTIPNSVTKIEKMAFRDCKGLTSVTIPNSVTKIEKMAFRNCKGLTSITIPNSVITIGDSAFYNCFGLTSVTIPNSVSWIGRGAFNECDGLTSVTINSNAICSETYISSKIGTIFDSQVKEYIIGNSVTTIGDYAFAYCTGLTSITIPNSVTTIGWWAFDGCNSLTSIISYATQPPTCRSSCFYNVSKSIPVYVPAQSVDAYKQADEWKDFTNILPISAEEVPTTDKVIAEPTDNSVTITWPQTENADTYTLEIKRNNELICTLTFDANGVLTSIAFAPTRDGAREMASAEMTANGWQFTVTGLTPGSKYAYAVDVINAQQQSIKQYTGEFTTTGGISTDWNQLTDSPVHRFTKIIKDNHLLIFRGDKIYNAAGGLIK